MGKMYPLLNRDKRRIFAYIKDFRDNIFNMDYLKEYLSNGEDLKDLDICKLLKIRENQFYPCKFIYNNYAWISTSSKGKQRYFTKRGFCYGLDVYDLLCLYFNCKFSQLENHLYNYGHKSNEFNNNEVSKYSNNIDKYLETIKKYKYILDLISDKSSIYAALNEFGRKNFFKSNKYKNNSLFFVSVRHLKETYDLPYSISTISQVINLLSVIGLIEKVPFEEVKESVEEYYKINKLKSPVTFYIIPNIDDVIERANNLSKVLINNNVKYYKLTKNKLKCLNNYGVEFNTTNKGGGDKTKKSLNNHSERVHIENLFYYHLYNDDIIAKEWIVDKIDITSTTVFNKIWNELSNKSNLKKVIPNKRLINKYNLRTKQEILIVNRR